MSSASLSTTQALLWLTAVSLLALISRHSLRNPRSHGFYRFFAFASCVAVVIPNLQYWHDDMWARHQIASWIILFSALGLVGNALYLLIVRGGQRQHKPAEHFGFENTAQLVESGVFGWIRHPMYSALLLFTWGAWLKHANWLGLAFCLATTLLLWLTARVEEAENQSFFGEVYKAYSQRTKRFIPFIL